ncbi:MAG: ribose-phosphate pyrophosphokinase [Myxococcaceae bacterium]|nr:ribose-phosphate pyrophosphokinase [Myxococcaceae bacterium]MBH2006090.1 ribose-phosphate pyrophosphokinase [Myxococcaceae bacterium]
MRESIRIFSGSSNPLLAERVAQYLKTPLGARKINHFADGETFVAIEESVRGHHVYSLQSISPPANENVMELLIMIDALKRASASEITVVIPYYGYARQDRKAGPREPITAKLLADLLEVAGATRVISIDLHAAQIQGFFNIPVDNLYATPIFIEDIQAKFRPDEIVIVSPDAGGVERARSYAKKLQAGLAIIDKRRPKPNVAEVMNIIGEVEGKAAIIIDDMIDTAGTLVKGAEAVKKAGAIGVWAYATHGVLSGEAVSRIDASCLEEVVITDSIPLRGTAAESEKVRVLSCASLVGEAIQRVHTGASISSLFV